MMQLQHVAAGSGHPTKHTKDSPTTREHGVYTPFGVGAHSCLGAGLAEIQMVATMAALLNSGKLEMLTKPGPLKIKIKPVATPVGVRVRIRNGTFDQ